jgi:hypothetical protein
MHCHLLAKCGILWQNAVCSRQALMKFGKDMTEINTDTGNPRRDKVQGAFTDLRAQLRVGSTCQARHTNIPAFCAPRIRVQ